MGTENENLPGFVVLISSGVQPNGGKNSYGSGFLPSIYQGVQCRSKGDPVLFVSDPPGMQRDLRRDTLDALRDLNEIQVREFGSPETRIGHGRRVQTHRLVAEGSDDIRLQRKLFDCGLCCRGVLRADAA